MVAQARQGQHGRGASRVEQLPSFDVLDRMIRAMPVERRYSATGKGWSDEWRALLDARDRTALQDTRDTRRGRG